MNAKEETSPRRVTIRKLQRDAQNLRAYARYVLVLKDGFVTVVDNADRRKKHLPYAKIIAVLGPVEYAGKLLQESVLMEIGYSRTRPYAQLEEQSKDEHGNRLNSRWHLKSRSRARILSDEELMLVYQHIVQCMTSIVLEQRESWTTKKPWFVKGARYVDRGIFFTISQSDALMHRCTRPVPLALPDC